MEAAEVRIGPFRLDVARRELLRGGATVRLGSRAIEILCALASAKGQLVTKDELMARVWPGVVVEENAIQVHVSALRKVLGETEDGSSYVITVPGRGYRLVIARTTPLAASENGAQRAVVDKPPIAVLPFTNMSGDREQEYFADGISEDIITALSRSRWFFVIARNSSFVFKGTAISVKDVARELGVRYVLEGSVRKSGQRVRITAQLVDAEAGTHVWAERYDLELSDIFQVQDELTERVAGAIEPELLKSEGLRASRRGTGNLSAWDLVRQGTWQFHKITKPTHLRARELFREAIKLDPQLPEAHMWLGRVNESIVGYGWSDNPAADLREAVKSSLHAVRRATHSGSFSARPLSTPIRRMRSPCCALAANGHAAVLPRSLMNSRRLIAPPEAKDKTSYPLKLDYWKGLSVRAMSALGQKQTFAPQKVMSALPATATWDSTRVNKKPRAIRPRVSWPRTKLDQAACFRFLRQPSRPNAPRPVAKSGSVAGSGVALDSTVAVKVVSPRDVKVRLPAVVSRECSDRTKGCR